MALPVFFFVSRIRPNEINHNVARELAAIDPLTGKKAEPIPLGQLFKRNAIIIFNISLILYYICNGVQIALVGQMLANLKPHISALLIAGCMIIAELTMIGIAYSMRFIVNRYSRRAIFLTAFFILPTRAILYTLTDNPAFLLAIQVLDGTAAGILGVMGGVINSDLAVNTGRFNFLQGMGALSTSCGVFLSNVFAGLVARSFGFHIGFFSLASVGLFGALFFALLMPETKDQPVKADL